MSHDANKVVKCYNEKKGVGAVHKRGFELGSCFAFSISGTGKSRKSELWLNVLVSTIPL